MDLDGTNGTTTGDQAAQQMQQAAAQAPPDATQTAPPTQTAPVAAAPAPTSPYEDENDSQGSADPTATNPQAQHVGLLKSVLNMLSSRDNSTVSIDPETGKRVVTPGAPPTTAQQIAQIGLEALRGAAAGLAAPPGPGHVSQGAAAGINAGINDSEKSREAKEAQAENDYARQQKLKIDNLNYQILTRKLASGAVDDRLRDQAATRDQIRFSGEMEKTERDLHSVDLGVYPDVQSIPEVQQKNPDVLKALKDQQIAAVPVYGADGKPGGVHFFQRRPDANDQLAPKGATAIRYQMGPDGKGQLVSFTPTAPDGGPVTNGDILRYNMNAKVQMHDEQKDAADLAYKQAQAKEANANADAAPIKAQSEAAKNYAEAAEARQKTAAAAANGGADLNDQQIVSGMLNNTLDIRTIASLRADHRQALIREALKQNPNWNEKQYESAMDTIKDFTSGKTSQTVQSFNRFTGHADGLLTTADELRNTRSPLINQPLNKIKTDLGSTARADVRPIMDATANEHMAFLLNGRAPHEEDVRSREQALNDNMSPAQMEGAVKSMMRVQLTQLGAMNYRHQMAVGRPAYGMIDPASRAIIQKAGLEDYAKKELGAAYYDSPQQHQAAPAAAPATATPVTINPGEKPLVNPQTGQQIVLRNNQWVDVKTGQVAK